MPEDLIAELRTLAARVAESHGLEIFDLQFRREASGVVLRVVIDRGPTGSARGRREDSESPGAGARATGGGAPVALSEESVGIADCQHVSRDLSALLDVEEDRLGLPDVKYTLEVSSPGLDRPLRGEADYRRFEGRLAKIVTVEPVGGQSSFAGHLAGVDDGHVLLQEGRRTHRVPLTLIKRARLDIEF